MATSKITIEQYIGFEKKKETKGKVKIPFAKILSFTILAAFCLIWVLPFIIMFTGSLRGYMIILYILKNCFIHIVDIHWKTLKFY